MLILYLLNLLMIVMIGVFLWVFYFSDKKSGFVVRRPHHLIDKKRGIERMQSNYDNGRQWKLGKIQNRKRLFNELENIPKSIFSFFVELLSGF